MEVTATLDTAATPEALAAVVRDLGTYPDWLDIVGRAEPDGEGEWLVDLRGQLGPLRRTKRLRMLRTGDDPGHVRFERVENDGRQHSPWELDAALTTLAGGTRLTMRLHYGGSLWMPLLDRLLRDEIERSKPRLAAYLETARRS